MQQSKPSEILKYLYKLEFFMRRSFKPLILIFLLFIMLSFIHSEDYKLDIDFNGKKTFQTGEDITFKVILRDSSNKIIYKNINVVLQDIEKEYKIEKTINTGELVILDLNDKRKSGEWKVSVKESGSEAEESFFIESKEELSISIKQGELIIENTGNIKINQEIKIKIGDTEGEPKNLNLDIGERETYKLIAPEGNYQVKVLSEGKSLFSMQNVPLENTGFTGNAIGTVNKDLDKKNSLTGGISPDEENRDAVLQFMKRNKIVYAFIIVIFGATILLAIERKYSSMQKNDSK